MSRIEWTRIAGEDVEHVVAVLLCSQNPAAQMIRPGRGDGGLDVIVPVGADQHDVYQVKKFTENLTSSHKRQIKKSFTRLNETIAAGDINVRNWFVTLPLDPTPGNRSWLKTLTEDATYTCAWRGLTFIESLAARYPNVIDYYLRDGKDRLRDTLRDLTTLATASTGDGVMTPTDLWPVLDAAMRTVDTDPHFRYGISLDPIEPTPPPDDPAIFVTTHHDAALDRWISIRVYERFAEALKCRPITLNVQFNAEPGSELANDLARWHRFGAPFTAPEGTVDVKADLPGGLDGNLTGGSLQINASGTTPRHLRLVLADENGHHLAVTPVTLTAIATGQDRQGFWNKGTDDGGALTIETTGHFGEQTMSMSFTPNDLTGLDPATLGPGLNFTRHLPTAHAVGVALQYGPIKDIPLERLDRNTATFPNINPAEIDLISRLAQALTDLQDHATFPIRMPDLAEFTKRQAWDLISAVRLANGETLTNVSATSLCNTSGADIPTEPFQAAATQPLTVLYDGHEIPLGDLYVFGSHIAATATGEHDGHTDYELRPIPGTTWTYSLNPADLPVDIPALDNAPMSPQPQISMLAAPGPELTDQPPETPD